jgi:hypothetical protein
MSVNFAINTARTVLDDFGPGYGTVDPGHHPLHPPVECPIKGCGGDAVEQSWVLPFPPPPPYPSGGGGDPFPAGPRPHVHAEE